MWNHNSTTLDSQEEDDSWEVKAFAEDAGNAMGATWPPRSYTCTFCRREFRSAQALGGHMNVHRHDRARLHQAQLNFKNPNLLVPSDELVADGGLCLLFSLPNPNSMFKPSSFNNLNGNPLAGPFSGNLMNLPAVVAPPHGFNYSLSNSRDIEASTAIDYKHNQPITRDNEGIKTELECEVEGIDLELRLGCSSSGS